jgi:RNA polymerase primary sigma factor
MLWKLKNVAQEYEDEFGIPPSQKELAELLGVSVESMKSIIACAGSSISLDANVNFRGDSGGGGRRIQDLIPDERGMSADDRIDRQKVSHIVKRAMNTLTEREEKIIRLRFGISENPNDSSGFPISKQAIKQMKSQANKQKKGVCNHEHA